MKILALEFSSPVRGVAVAVQDMVCGRAQERGERHTHPFKLIDSALLASDLEREEIECIAIGTGPGSYAGIRIAIAIAQGWQLAWGVKLLGISSTEVVAAQVVEGGQGKPFAIGIDAQREKLFLAQYFPTARGATLVVPFHASDEKDQARHAAGEVCFRPDLLETNEQGMIALPPSAESLARLAMGRTDFIAGDVLKPVYLRLAEFIKSPPSKFGAV